MPDVLPITAMVLAWKRPNNTVRIANHLEQVCSHVVVWNNNPEQTYSPEGRIDVIQASRDMGLITRLCGACLARTDAILFHDDDLLAPHETIRALFAAWRNRPLSVHGVEGRDPKPDGTYAAGVAPPAECAVVLTRLAMAPRALAVETLRVWPLFEHILLKGDPPGNGEDILMSYVARKLTGQRNVIHELPVEELDPGDDSIWRRPGHWEHRTVLMRACEKWISEKPAEKSTPSFKPPEMLTV